MSEPFVNEEYPDPREENYGLPEADTDPIEEPQPDTDPVELPEGETYPEQPEEEVPSFPEPTEPPFQGEAEADVEIPTSDPVTEIPTNDPETPVEIPTNDPPTTPVVEIPTEDPDTSGGGAGEDVPVFGLEPGDPYYTTLHQSYLANLIEAWRSGIVPPNQLAGTRRIILEGLGLTES